MALRFAHPALLALLVLVPLAVRIGLASDRLPPGRRRWSVMLRAVVLGALVLGLASPRVVLPVEDQSVAFLVDASDSVPPAERARAEDFVLRAVAGMSPDDRAAVVVFGDRALVDRAPRAGPLEPLRSRPGTARTDLGAALRLGLAVLPADTGRRLVVLSDGRANRGDVLRQAEIAAAAGVPVDVVALAAAVDPREVLVAALEAPASSRVGQRFDLTAVVRAGAPGRARLQVLAGEATLADRDVDLVAGDNRFAVPVTVGAPGFHRYRAVVAPEHDGRAENNVAAAFTVVAGPPRVLVVASAPDRAAPLVAALEGAEREVVQVAPGDAPSSLLGLADFETVVLVDVEAPALPGGFMAALEAAVRDLGHGLVMVGGEASFGAGRYKDTPVERALPVDMEVRDREERPDLAMAFVVDKSGSMASCDRCGAGGGGGGGAFGGRKVDLAKEAVVLAASLLRAEDHVALVAFDDRSHLLWPARPYDAPADFEAAVGAVQADGGTNIFAGLSAAVREIEGVDAPLRHVILLTDGWSDASGYGALQDRMASGKITLSVVAVGSDSAPYLRELADGGGGRYHAVVDPADVPQVFVEETMTALGTYIVEERFQPAPGASSTILGGLDPATLPPLGGYNGTTAKQSAQVALWSHLDDPVLAQWQYGLGRAVAWTSDLKRQWAAEWVDRELFGPFAVQLVDWTLPPPDDEGLVLETALDGARATLTLRAFGPAGGATNFLDAEAHLVGEGGVRLVVPLGQSAAGEYVGEVDLPGEGAYLMRVVAEDEAGVVGARTAGLVVGYSPEYADPAGEPTDPRLWRLAEQTGGRVLDSPAAAFAPVPGVTRSADAWPWLLLLAAALFPLDVATRRLKLSRADVHAATSRLGARARAALPSRTPAARLPGERALGSLFAARDRAGTRRERPEPRGETGSGPRPAPPPTGVMPEEPLAEEGAAKEAGEDRMARLREAKRRARRGQGSDR